jgi:hypothetical protein
VVEQSGNLYDQGGGKYADAVGIAIIGAGAIGPTDGEWVHGAITCTDANTAYTATVSTPIAAPYLKVIAQVSATDTTPVEAVVRINNNPTASTSTNINGIGYRVSGSELISLDGTTVETVRAMSPTAGAYVAFCLANPTVA